ncbi:MAG TPA: HPP family protein [Ktedonobacterales bacterium]|nr:HPP family protein [Ktedonobacterales bacterium]
MMEIGEGAPEDRWLRRFRMLWALVILPLFLAIVALLVGQTNMGLALFPPLAAIGFTLFMDPWSKRATVRSIMAGPVIGAAIGAVTLAVVPAGPLRILLVTAFAIVALYWLRSELAPALAVALLTLLVGVRDGPLYVLAIALGTSALAVIFFAWRRYIYERATTPPPDEVDTNSGGAEPQPAAQ